MNPRLPDLLPGEIYQWWLERVRILNNYQSIQAIHRDLRDIAFCVNPSSTDHFHKTAAAVTATDYSDFIEQHTLVPFLLLPNKSAYFRSGRWIASPWNYQNDSVSHVLSAAKKCLTCEEIDRQKLGFTYLRRDHQIPGVMWCLIHQCPLEWVDSDLQKSTASRNDPGAFELVKKQVLKLICGQ